MHFDPQPILSDAAIRLRPLTEADRLTLAEVASDPAIWEQHPDRRRHTPEGFKAYFDACLASGMALVIEDRAQDRLIGASRFAGREVQSEVEIGWTFLSRAYWGGTWNRRAKALMVSYALKSFDTVVFLVGVDNIRSQKAVEAIGAVADELSEDRSGTPSRLYRLNAAAAAPLLRRYGQAVR